MAKKILAVEDSPTILAIIKTLLQDAGYEVIAATDGQDALNRARKEKADLIAMDLMLPKLDGYKVCAMLKFDEKYKKTPIIILIARADEKDKKMGQEVAADAYITKPFQPENLLSKIKELIKE